ncbi:MAG: DUF1841 family protein [Pseudomonadota bacterium]
MLFGNDRNELRRMYVQAWRLKRAGQPMSALEAQIAEVVGEHPEYHAMLVDDAVEADFAPEHGQSNPFLHMGMHLAIREQVSTNRPVGIRDVHAQLAGKMGGPHEAEHAMLECLGEALWRAQRDNTLPDELAYLESLNRLL